jgi:hypothetical protein
VPAAQAKRADLGPPKAGPGAMASAK